MSSQVWMALFWLTLQFEETCTKALRSRIEQLRETNLCVSSMINVRTVDTQDLYNRFGADFHSFHNQCTQLMWLENLFLKQCADGTLT